MTPMQIELALSVIRLASNAIQSRMKQHDELLDLFTKASEAERDLTDEEVAMWKAKADEAIAELNTLIDGL